MSRSLRCVAGMKGGGGRQNLTNDASLPASSAVGPYYGEALSHSVSISTPAPTFAIPHVEKWQPRSQERKRKCDLVKRKAAINDAGHIVLISRAFLFFSFHDALGSRTEM